jgi:VWFA-related protein
MMRRPPHFLLLTPALAATIAAAQPPPSSPETFTEILEVRVVNLEVVITGPDGERVTGLSPADFAVEIDDRPVVIDYFTEVRQGRAMELPTALGQLGPQALPAAPEGSPVGTSYLLFLDDFFTVKPQRNRVLRGLVDHLTRLEPQDRVAVVAYDGRRLTQLCPWSPPGAAVRRSLELAMERPTRGLERRLELRTGNQDVGVVRNQPYPQLLEEQVRNVLAAADATLRSFAQPAGRRVMLLAAGSWPADPVTYTAGEVDAFGSRLSRNLAGRLRELVATANRLGYSLYPIDVQGASAESPVDVTGTAPGPTGVGLVREAEEHHTLASMAYPTGGLPLLNAQRETALARAVEDTRSYYWLGFVPAGPPSQRDHRFRVTVRRPGLTVRHRDGYRELTRAAEAAMQVESALLFGDLGGALPLEVEVLGATRAGRGTVHIPLRIFVPLDRVTVLPQGGQYICQLELRLAAIDQEGHRSEIPAVPVRLTGSQAPQAGAKGVYEHTLLTRVEQQDVMVVLHDPYSGTVLSRRLELDPKKLLEP